jgi:hypothetical protein
MAIAVVLEFEGATVAHYDQMIERMGFSPGGPGGSGGLFHWVTETENGLRVTDVWESREHFETFANTQIGPVSQELGLPNPPTITFYEVHSYLTAG